MPVEIETVRIPHELVMRWDDHGVLLGAHVKERQAKVVAGEVIGLSQPGDAEGLALEPGGRWPLLLRDYLSEVQLNALASVQTLTGRLAEAEAEKVKMKEDFEDKWKQREEEIRAGFAAMREARKARQKDEAARRAAQETGQKRAEDMA